MKIDFVSVVGWLASVVLLATMFRQVYTQWRDGTVGGVSHWLFVGQIATSVGFVVYSVAKKDPVFVFTNSLMFLNAVFGFYVDRRNRRESGV